MAGVFCQEGTIVSGAMFLNQSSVDRGTSLKIGLFTNSSGLSSTTTYASIIQALFTGYAEQTIVDANWTETASGGVATWVNSGAPFTFTCSGATVGSNPAVFGYYIRTTGTTPRLIGYEIDSGLGGSGAVFVSGNSYAITPSIPVS